MYACVSNVSLAFNVFLFCFVFVLQTEWATHTGVMYSSTLGIWPKGDDKVMDVCYFALFCFVLFFRFSRTGNGRVLGMHCMLCGLSC